MLDFVLRRLGQALPVAVLSSVVIFLLLHLVPGDPARLLAGPDATVAQVQIVRHELGLDRPLPLQYLAWLGNALHGNLGRSSVNQIAVTRLVAQRVPATVELTLGALALEVAIAVPAGLLAAAHRGGTLDWVVSSANAIALAVPNFWLGILAILLFSLVFSWLPPGGWVGLWPSPFAGLKFLVLPASTLVLGYAAVLSRYVRSSVIDVLSHDHVRTARAKGVPERVVLRRHVLRNALIPIATVLGLQFGRMLGGVVVIEAVFAWPGMGSLLLGSVESRDYPVVQGTLLLFLIAFIVVNLATDIAYGLIDPRIRLAGGARRQ